MATQLVITINEKPHIWSKLMERYLPVRDSKTAYSVRFPKRVLTWAARHGTPEDHYSCVYALAWSKDSELTGVVESAVRTNHTYLRFVGDLYWTKFTNPAEIKQIIRQFDERGAAVAFGDTFTISLTPVQDSQKQGYRRGMSGTNSTRRPASNRSNR